MTCETCIEWSPRIGSLRAAFAFDWPIRDAIHRFKYQGEFARAGSLAELMFHAIFRPEFVEDPSWDSIAFVPLHTRRRRQRGFDQAELLSRHLAGRMDLPRESGLSRRVDTPTQVGRGEAERRENMRGAFAWTAGPLSGERILLIDDVLTTGSTMSSAAEALIAAGAGRVDGFALAREL